MGRKPACLKYPAIHSPQFTSRLGLFLIFAKIGCRTEANDISYRIKVRR